MLPVAGCDAGIEAARGQHYARAEQLLTECAQSAAATLPAFLMLAAVHQARGDDAALLNTALVGLKRFPDEKRFYLTAGTIAGRRREFDQAIAVLEQAVERWPHDVKLRSLLESGLFGRGTRYLDQGDNDKAQEDLSRAVKLAPGDVEAWMNLGRARQNVLRYADALEAFDQVSKRQPDFPLLKFHRGVSHFSLGNFAAAVQELDAQISAQPDYPPAFLLRGLSRLSLGIAEQAVADLEIAAARMPEAAQAHFALGRALLQMNRAMDAEPHLRRAVALNPKDVSAANTLVRALMNVGKRDEARELARKAAQLARELR